MSLRVRAPLPKGEERRGPGGAPMPPMDDGYMSRMVKLVPAEAVGPFPFLLDSAQRLPLPQGSPRWGVYFVAWVLLLVVVVLRARATSEPGAGAQWGGVLIAAVAFVIWVHVLGGDFGLEILLNKMLAGAGADGISRATGGALSPDTAGQVKTFVSNVTLTAWTILAPAIYRGDDSTTA